MLILLNAQNYPAVIRQDKHQVICKLSILRKKQSRAKPLIIICNPALCL
jgi:hypothetical protein